MKEEEAKNILIQELEEDPWMRTEYRKKIREAINMGINALDQDLKNNYKAFAEWVAGEVIDEELWEWNSGGFPEVACRKLNKLGIVNTDGKRWIYGSKVLP